MKLNFSSLIGSALATVALALSGCGEDRSGEYYALIQEDKWIYDQMDNIYLWYEDMPTKTEKDFFADPEDFFESLLSKKCRNGKGDTFSTFEEGDNSSDEVNGKLLINETSSYGFDFILYNDPTGTTAHKMARVLFVLPDSPAANAGLKRGDWILQVGGYNITSNNYGYLIQGAATTLTTASIQVSASTDETGSTSYDYQWANKVELSMSASRAIQVDPFLKTSVLQTTDNRLVGYLLYDSFKSGITDDSTEYTEEMKKIFEAFKRYGVQEFVLDLRYNLGGLLTCAQELSSCLVPSRYLNSLFVKTVYNDKNQSRNSSYSFLSDWSNYNLDLERVFVLTSSYTASASEAVINGLKPYMTVNVIGETTYGKNVGSIGITSSYGFTIRPIVATVYNSQDESEYTEGFTPNVLYSELNNYAPLGELGDPNSDALLYYALRWIVTGSAGEDTDTATEQTLKAFGKQATRVADKQLAPLRIHRAMSSQRGRGDLLKQN